MITWVFFAQKLPISTVRLHFQGNCKFDHFHVINFVPYIQLLHSKTALLYSAKRLFPLSLSRRNSQS